eukprot:1121756-Amphidinium_carterae.1
MVALEGVLRPGVHGATSPSLRVQRHCPARQRLDAYAACPGLPFMARFLLSRAFDGSDWDIISMLACILTSVFSVCSVCCADGCAKCSTWRNFRTHGFRGWPVHIGYICLAAVHNVIG